jgi:hypothetical protein
VHINLDKSVTHHLTELTLDAFQCKVATNFLSNEFTQYCDDSYSSGVSDVNLKDFSEILLKLQSTSLAIVGIIQQTKTKAVFKQLFPTKKNRKKVG